MLVINVENTRFNTRTAVGLSHHRTAGGGADDRPPPPPENSKTKKDSDNQ